MTNVVDFTFEYLRIESINRMYQYDIEYEDAFESEYKIYISRIVHAAKQNRRVIQAGPTVEYTDDKEFIDCTIDMQYLYDGK